MDGPARWRYEPTDGFDLTTGNSGEPERVATALDHGLLDAAT